MQKYQVHNDYRNLNVTVPLNVHFLPVLQKITRFLYDREPIPKTIDHQKLSIQGYDGQPIDVEFFKPHGSEAVLPCLIYLHGGAFALPATDFHKKLIYDYVRECNTSVLFVDYRLVPKHLYPYGLEDCYSAYSYLLEHAKDLAVDPQRVAVIGDSAGGCLAAALTLLIRERERPSLLFQLLIYPVLDADCESKSMQEFTDTPIWNAKQNIKMWNLYLPSYQQGDFDQFASPLKTKNYDCLPNAYIEVNEFDCLRDEAITYAERLSKSGIDVVLQQNKGAIHGFEVNYKSSYTQQIIKKRIAYMNQQFGNN